jgi:hypothetical protein
MAAVCRVMPEPGSGTQRCWYTTLPCGILDGVGMPERRTNRMNVHMPMAEAVRQACMTVALQA